MACKRRRARGGRGAFPPAERLEVMAMAPHKPRTSHCPATRWRLDELGAALHQRRLWTMSRASIWRIVDEADLKPPRRVYWRNSPAPDCAAQAQEICSFSRKALRFLEQGRVGMCPDEKTGRPILQRQYSTPPSAPGKPAKCEPAYIRHGVRALLASFVVPTGHGVWHLGQPRTSADFATQLAHVVQPLPDMHRDAWVVENLKTHWSLAVCRLGAGWCKVPCGPKDLSHGAQRRAFLSAPSHKPVFHCTPKQGSWLNQVAWWLSV